MTGGLFRGGLVGSFFIGCRHSFHPWPKIIQLVTTSSILHSRKPVISKCLADQLFESAAPWDESRPDAQICGGHSRIVHDMHFAATR